jgi:hypothetical protein
VYFSTIFTDCFIPANPGLCGKYLRSCLLKYAQFAYKMFTTTDEIGWKQSNAFKKVRIWRTDFHLIANLLKAFSIDVDIEFVGVW